VISLRQQGIGFAPFPVSPSGGKRGAPPPPLRYGSCQKGPQTIAHTMCCLAIISYGRNRAYQNHNLFALARPLARRLLRLPTILTGDSPKSR